MSAPYRSGAGAVPSFPSPARDPEGGDNGGGEAPLATFQHSANTQAGFKAPFAGAIPLPSIQLAARHVATKLLSPSASTPAVTPSHKALALSGPGAALSPANFAQAQQHTFKARGFALFNEMIAESAAGQGSLEDSLDVESTATEAPASHQVDAGRVTSHPLGLSSLTSALQASGLQNTLATGVQALMTGVEQQVRRRRTEITAGAMSLRRGSSGPSLDSESGELPRIRDAQKRVFSREEAYAMMKKGQKMSRDVQAMVVSMIRRRKLDRPAGLTMLGLGVIILIWFLTSGGSSMQHDRPVVAPLMEIPISAAPPAPAGATVVPVSSEHVAPAPALASFVPEELVRERVATHTIPAPPPAPKTNATVVTSPHKHLCKPNMPVVNDKTGTSYVYCATEAMTWHEANESARGSGGILAEIKSPQERNFILREILWPCFDEKMFLQVTDNTSSSEGESSEHNHYHGAHAVVVKRQIGPMIGAHSIEPAMYEKLRKAQDPDYKTESEKHPQLKVVGDNNHEHDHLANRDLYPMGTFAWSASGLPVPLSHEGSIGGGWPIDPVNPHGIRLHHGKKDMHSEGHQTAYTLAWAITDTENHNHMGAEDELELAWTALEISSDPQSATPGNGKFFFLVESHSHSGELDLSKVCKKASAQNNSTSSSPHHGSGRGGGLLINAVEKVADVVEEGLKELKQAARRMRNRQ
jgi:hypothetical protein